MEMKPFDQADWNAFAGADSGEGINPHIAYTEQRGEKQRTIIADATGLHVIEVSAVEAYISFVMIQMSYDNALIISEGLKEDSVWAMKLDKS